MADNSSVRDKDEFVLDPSQISLYTGATGIAGAAFKREHAPAGR
jgi:hypothetical protein